MDGSDSAAPGDTRIRVLSYNIKAARLDRAGLGRIVRAVAPDLMAVQEGPGRLRWRSPAARLARDSALLWLGGGGPPAGRNLLLGQMRVDSVLTWSQRFPTTLAAPVRGIAAGVFRIGGRTVGLAGVHLPLDGEQRRRYAELLAVVVGELRARAGAVVVAGDLNEDPGAPVWRRLVELGLADAVQASAPTSPSSDPPTDATSGPEFTFPARHSQHRLDTIWTGGAVQVLAAGVPGRSVRVPDVHADDLVVASDHLPVMADLRLSGDPSEPGSG